MTGAVVKVRNPFPGLRAFEERETHLFFGRDTQSAELLTRLRGTRFLAVVGASGSGKSSLVKAGLLPSLHGGFMAGAGSRWRVVDLRPGSDPIGNLAAALSRQLGTVDPAHEGIDIALTEAALKRSPAGLVNVIQESVETPNTNVLVLVDQFEELFRYQRQFRKRSPIDRRSGTAEVEPNKRRGLDRRLGLQRPLYDDRAAEFVKLLLEANRQHTVPVYVVITMRSDFLGDCARFRDLPEAINDAQYLVPRMTRDQRREAVTGPAAIGGAQFEGRLVQRFLNDVGESPDQLPILQHALMRTWQEWERQGDIGTPIRLDHYQRVGGWDHALSRHADEALADVPDALKDVAKKLFTCLTERDGEGRMVRRPTSVADICAITGASFDDVITVVETFRQPERSFLRTDETITPASTIDISHESLIRNWDHVKKWAEAEAESAAMYRRLAEAAALYFGPDQEDPESLVRGHRLALGLQWYRDETPTAAWAARYGAGFAQAIEFLERSQEAEEDRDRKEREHAERERQREREMALKEQERLQALADARETEAEAARAAEEHKAKQYVRALWGGAAIAVLLVAVGVLGLAANAAKKRAREIGASAAFSVSGRARELARADSVNESLANLALALRLSPRNREVEALITDELVDRPWAVPVWEIDNAGILEPAAFSPSGKLLVTVSPDSTAQLWEVASRRRVGPPLRHDGAVQSAMFSADLSFLLTISTDSAARVWEPTTGGLRRQLDHEGLRTAAISPDGKWILTAGSNGFLYLWNADSVERAIEVGNGVSRIAFSEDSKRFAAADPDTVVVWDLEGNIEHVLPHITMVTALGFRPGAPQLLTTVRNGVTRLWDLTKANANSMTLQCNGGPCGGTLSALYSPDGRHAVAVLNDSSVRLWDAGTGDEIEVLPHNWPVESVAFAENGHRLVTAADQHPAVVWQAKDISTHTGFVPLAAPVTQPSQGPVAVLSPDGTLVATSSHDPSVQLAELRPALAQVRVLEHQGSVTAAAFSPTSSLVATASKDGSAYLWDPHTGDPVGDTLRHDGHVVSVVFSQDGTRLLTSSRDSTARLWDVASSAPIGMPMEHQGPVTLARFNAAGTRIITASGSETLQMWDGNTATPIGPALAHDGPVSTAAFSPDGRRVITGSGRGRVTIWNAESGDSLAAVAHQGRVKAVAFSPDGRRIASGYRNVLVWDASSGDTVTPIPVGQLIEALAFSHDGQRLVTAAGKQAVVWDAATGRQLSEPMEHARTIKAVSFSPGDDFILTASRDTTARVWFASTGLPATDPLPHRRTVQTAAFSPDGRLIVTASDDGSAQVWDFFSLRPATGILEGMAEAIGGMRINTEGALVPLEGRISALDSLSVACRDEVGPYVVLCRDLIGSAVGASASGSK